MISVTIPDWRPTSLNEMRRVHHIKAWKLKKADERIVGAYFMGKKKAEAKRRVKIHITLTGRQREADPDAYFKSLLDALVKCGMLVDDSNAWCEITTPTYGRALKGSTTITLEDVC